MRTRLCNNVPARRDNLRHRKWQAVCLAGWLRGLSTGHGVGHAPHHLTSLNPDKRDQASRHQTLTQCLVP